MFKKWVLPNLVFGDPASKREEVLMIFVTNLEMLNLAKLSFFRHPVYPDIAVAWNALFFISEANTAFGHHIPKEWSLSMFAEIFLVFFLIHNPAIHNPESSQCWQTSPMPKYFQFCSSDLLTDGKFLRLYYRLYVDVVRYVNGFQSVTPKFPRSISATLNLL